MIGRIFTAGLIVAGAVTLILISGCATNPKQIEFIELSENTLLAGV